MVERRLLKNFDFGLLGVMLAIILYGLAIIYSASRRGDGIGFIHRQVVWAVIGIIAYGLAASVDHKNYPRLARWVFGINLVLLLAVLVVGHSSKGAQRWIGIGSFVIQPSEFAKIAVIVTMAAFIAKRQSTIGELKTFVLSFVYVSAPLLLIFKQPDLGTTLVIVTIWLGMMFVAGAKPKHLLAFMAIVLLIGTIGWESGVLKDYQKKRLTSFIDPSIDAKGTGYHMIQARIAIGSGQFTGKGWRHGTQSQLGFIPERHTDFIFTVVAEELGFVGAGALLLLYALMIWKGLVVMSETEDVVGRLAAAGIVCMFLFHIVVNIGMTLGIMPVTGVPLPLFSYGGSSLLANMMSLGLLSGIGMRRHKINF